MKFKPVVVLLAGGLALSGCATITRGTHDNLLVQTTPDGAQVKTSLGKGFGCDSTPCSIRAKRNAEFDVDITKTGYKGWHGHVTHKVSSGGGAAMAGNVLVGGIIGAVVDGSNGAMDELTPNPLTVTLEKSDDAASSSAASASSSASTSAAGSD